jgi:hypothetical protein
MTSDFWLHPVVPPNLQPISLATAQWLVGVL